MRKSPQSLTFRVFGKHGPELNKEELMLRAQAVSMAAYRKKVKTRKNRSHKISPTSQHPKVALWLKLSAEAPKPVKIVKVGTTEFTEDQKEKIRQFHISRNLPLPADLQ